MLLATNTSIATIIATTTRCWCRCSNSKKFENVCFGFHWWMLFSLNREHSVALLITCEWSLLQYEFSSTANKILLFFCCSHCCCCCHYVLMRWIYECVWKLSDGFIKENCYGSERSLDTDLVLKTSSLALVHFHSRMHRTHSHFAVNLHEWLGITS